MTKQKQEGQYMTPKAVVDMVLDSIGYVGADILTKRVCEPSFGTGAFLVGIASRVIKEGRRTGLTNAEIASTLVNHIYGFEKDEKLYRQGIERLNLCLRINNLEPLVWDNLKCADTLLSYSEGIKKMDFVVGNPPFVTVHNMSKTYRELAKQFSFSDGTINLYTVFFEVGYTMLCDTGKLGFISPNTFLKTKSHRSFREFLVTNRCLVSLWDFKDSKLFPTADVYSCITVLSKQKTEHFQYREYAMFEKQIEQEFLTAERSGNPWSFGTKEETRSLAKNKELPKKLRNLVEIQNAIATLRDHLFIHKMYLDIEGRYPYLGVSANTVYFQEDNKTWEIETGILRKGVKASTYGGTDTETYLIFPYSCQDGRCQPLEEAFLSVQYPLAFAYLTAHKEELLRRDLDKHTPWYVYGRKQGLSQYGAYKAVIKHTVKKTTEALRCHFLPKETLVYSGIVLTATTLERLHVACDYLQDPAFMQYARLVGKDMSGGYLSLSSRDIQEYGIGDFLGKNNE